MSKYIRTKDGIYEIVEEQPSYYIKLSKNGFDNYVPRENILKQADTIEELCDGWVVVNKEIKKVEVLFPLSRWNYIEAKEHAEYEESDLYGAIWIKGEHDEPILKPAAKMNKEGKLVLI